MNASDKFVVGETYTLRLSLNSEKLGKHAYFAEPWLDDMAYVFLDNLSGTTYQNNPMGYIVDFKYVAKGNVSSVDIEGIINPTEYTAMQTTGFNIIAEGVEFDSVEWNKTSGVEFPVPVTGKFQPDTDYRLVIHLRAKAGYAFNLTKNSVDCNVGTVNEVHQNSNEASIEIDFEIGAHTHNYNGDWKTDSTNHWKVCVCEEKAQIAAHTYDKGVVTKKAAYKQTGVKTYTCTECGNKKTETIPALKYELTKKGATIKDGKGNSYKVTKSHKTKGTVIFVKPKNKNVTNVTIPATVKVKGVTYKVTAIEKNAFVGCKKLTKVTIGKNVATIGTKAFYNCKKLKTITFKTTKLTAKKIGKNAFKGTNSKATVNIPKSKYNVYKKALKAKGVSAKAKFKKK
ncbi:MAG: leucine-rich repeat domain-containing protein [Lachnospiraceae bacterium]|nr:leucine-rich repeat domain-containing protein [Lachnospiraceae bacterium]